MKPPQSPGSQATETTPQGEEAPVIKNDLYTPMTLEEDPPGTQNSSEEEAAAPGPSGNPPAETPTPPDPGSEERPGSTSLRFKTHEEAENGYRHIHSHASRLEQEVKTLRETLASQQAEETATQEREARVAQLRQYATTRRAQLMKDIGELDPDAENHNDELGRLMAEADTDIMLFQQNPPAIEKPTGSDTSPQGEDTTPKAPGAALPAATPTLEEQEAAILTITTAAEAVGLPLTDPTFQGYSSKAPTEDADGKPIPLDQQTQWAIDQTQNTWLKHMAGEVQLDPEDPALQYFVSKAPTKDDKGNVLPLADRLRAAIKNTQTYHATHRSQAVQESGAPLSSGARFGVPPGGSPPGAPSNKAPAPTSLGAALSLANQHRTL